jgi:hypothetical protein
MPEVVKHDQNDLVALPERYRTLAEEWRRETGMESRVAQKVKHPAFLAIVAMGEPAIPLILEDLQHRPSHLFWAIQRITGENPVDRVVAGNVRAMIDLWIDWGKERGFVMERPVP